METSNALWLVTLVAVVNVVDVVKIALTQVMYVSWSTTVFPSSTLSSYENTTA